MATDPDKLAPVKIRFRETTSEDAPLIAEWIEKDPWHKGKMEASFFLPGEGYSSYAVEDGEGAVMFVRAETDGAAMRVHIEFAPGEKKRIASAIDQGLPAVVADARQRGYEALAFVSMSPGLVGYLARFGFEAEVRLGLK